MAETPADRSRKTIGVGEQVTLSSNASTWSVSGAGTLDTPAGNVVVLTASETAGTVTVTVSGGGCVQASVTYTVIAPSGLMYQAVDGILHNQGYADIGMHAKAYLLPVTVSFANVKFAELDATASASGPYACQNGLGHHPYPNPIDVGPNVPGAGSPIRATDVIDSGLCTGVDQRAPGSITISIPDVYVMTSGSVTQHRFGAVTQKAVADGAGNLSITKGGAGRTTTVDSPDSSY